MTTKISADNIQPTTLATIGSGPKISQILICDSNYVNLDDTAISLSGGFIKIIGSGFTAGATITVNRTAATSVTFVSATELRAQVGAQTAGSYIVYAVNSDGAVALRVNGLTYSSEPTWATGSTLTGDSGSAISIQLSAAGASTYALQAGSTLPAGLTLSSGGLLSGIITVSGQTVYNFVVVATDAELQDSPRSFSITITVGDSLFAATTLLLPGAVNTFVRDASTNNFPVTVVGDTRPSTLNPYLTGWSNSFDGSGDFLTLPSNQTQFTMGTGDFTIEMWVNISSLAVNRNLYDTSNGGDSNPTGRFSLRVTTSGTVDVYTGTGQSVTSGGTLAVGQWYHIAYVRISNNGRLYVNGTQVNTTATDNNNYVVGTSNRPIIGINSFDQSSEPMLGYISNLRVVKGTGVYTTTFTPATTPLTAIAGTSLLTCQSNRFRDAGTNNFAITPNGNVTVDSFSPFLEPQTTNGSGFFDGSGDTLSVASNTAFNLGAGDFTVEGWYNFNVLNVQGQQLFRFGGSTSAHNPFFFVWNDGTMYFRSAENSGEIVTPFASGMVTGVWYHWAVTRAGNTYTIYRNGVSVATGTSTAVVNENKEVVVGSALNGYVSNFRVVKGTAVYTAAFTPPTAPLTAVTNTSLLTLQNNQPHNNSQFLDSSTENFVITGNGNATQGTFSPYSPSGWSNYFTANTAYLTVASNAAFAFPGAFTVEGWFNWSTLPSAGQALGVLAAGGFNFTYGSGSLSFNNFGSGNIATATYTFVVGVWYHIAMTRNVSNTCTIWINGVSSATGSSAVSFAQGTWSIYGGSNNGGAGYASNLRVVKGTAVYTANFTPSTTPLTAIAGTSLLTCADNRFIDDSANNFAITRNGDARVTNWSPFRAQTQTPTTYSGYFDGSGDFLNIPAGNTALSLGTGDFTIELWMYGTSIASQAALIDTRNPDIQNASFDLLTGSSKLQFGGALATFIQGAATLIGNTWNHVAVTRSGNSFRMFLNGVQDGPTYTGSATQNFTNTNFRIASGANGAFTGYISNVRVVKGTALYTSSFTPATVPLTAIANTSLLTCQSPTFIDNSTNSFAITANGNSQPTAVNPFGFTFANTNGYSATEHGGSMYFDGTGDFLTIPGNRAFDLSAGPWTVECWFYQTSSKQAQLFSVGAARWRIDISTSQVVGWLFNTSSSQATNNTAPLNQWNHIAVCYNGTTCLLYLNGVAQTSGGALVPGSDTSSVFYVGRNVDAGSGWDFNGYISEIRIVKGRAVYTSSFALPIAPVQPVPGTTLLLNGTSAAVTDATTKNVLETVGGAQVSTVSNRFGGSSMFFGTSGGAYAQTLLDQPQFGFGTGNFTIEMWINPTPGNTYIFFDTRRQNESRINLGMTNNNTGIQVSVGTTAIITVNTGITAGSWNHVAVTRASGSLRLFINGTQAGSTTTMTTDLGAVGSPCLATAGDARGNGAYGYSGYIQDVRVTQGVARYTANFTVPAEAFQTK
jgi:hypothetical protein